MTLVLIEIQHRGKMAWIKVDGLRVESLSFSNQAQSTYLYFNSKVIWNFIFLTLQNFLDVFQRGGESELKRWFLLILLGLLKVERSMDKNETFCVIDVVKGAIHFPKKIGQAEA